MKENDGLYLYTGLSGQRVSLQLGNYFIHFESHDYNGDSHVLKFWRLGVSKSILIRFIKFFQHLVNSFVLSRSEPFPP